MMGLLKINREKREKPPIGLKPKFIRNLERFREVQEAIARYYNAEVPIPIDWIEEYNELIKLIKKS